MAVKRAVGSGHWWVERQVGLSVGWKVVCWADQTADRTALEKVVQSVDDSAGDLVGK